MTIKNNQKMFAVRGEVVPLRAPIDRLRAEPISEPQLRPVEATGVAAMIRTLERRIAEYSGQRRELPLQPAASSAA